MTLAVIPARGGSKGLPGKNIKKLNGEPLINYTIKAAREVFPDDQIIVSTDDEEIKRTAENTGLKVPFLRPAELATDNAGTQEVLLHSLKFAENRGLNPEVIVLLQPTSPFREAAHIKEALELYSKEIDMLVSVKETGANPYYVLKEENKQGYLENSKPGNFTRRQDCPKVWELNGAIYIINVQSFKEGPINKFSKIKKYVMDDFSSIDIDNEIDWMVAEKILESKKSASPVSRL